LVVNLNQSPGIYPREDNLNTVNHGVVFKSYIQNISTTSSTKGVDIKLHTF
jgi:hypothetical protein